MIAWIVGIFYLSAGKGSGPRTARIVLPSLRRFFPNAHPDELSKYHTVLRKACHLAGYAVLALLASMAFYNSAMDAVAGFWYVFAFGVVLIVAALDELLQSRHPDRIGSIADVALDCVGGLTAILLMQSFA